MRRLFIALVILAACVPGGREMERGPLANAFESAAFELKVPGRLLLAISWMETRWRTPVEVEDDPIHAAAGGPRGIMGLIERPDLPRLSTAASALGIDPELAEQDAAANIRAAAYVLRELALAAEGEIPESLAGWRTAVARYGSPDDELAGRYYAEDVFELMEQGVEAQVGGEHLVLPPSTERFGRTQSTLGGDVDFPGARWIPARAGHFQYGRRSRITHVIIHTTEGSYGSAINWFRSPNNPFLTSAHYVIRSSDGEVTQMVREQDTAHHIGGWNPWTIGIEHEARAAEGYLWFSGAMLRTSAAITRAACLRYGIPMDRNHIVGHVEVPGATHYDPGRYFPWDHYMQLVRDPNTTASGAPATSFSSVGTWIRGWGTPDWSASGDFDGDGKADVAWYENWNGGSVTLGLSNGNGVRDGGKWLQGFGSPDWAAAADFDGDGKDDLAWYEAWNDASITIALSTGSSFQHRKWLSGFGRPDWAGVGDFNGDGKDDIVWYEAWNGNTGTVLLSHGSGFHIAGRWLTGFGSPDWAAAADFDGDGKDDLAWYEHWNEGAVSVALSTGSGFRYGGKWLTGFGRPDWAAAADFTGDGRADIAWYERWNQGSITVAASNGSAFASSGRWISGWGRPDAAFAADFDGDRRTDVGWYELWNTGGLTIGLSR